MAMTMPGSAWMCVTDSRVQCRHVAIAIACQYCADWHKNATQVPVVRGKGLFKAEPLSKTALCTHEGTPHSSGSSRFLVWPCLHFEGLRCFRSCDDCSYRHLKAGEGCGALRDGTPHVMPLSRTNDVSVAQEARGSCNRSMFTRSPSA